MDTLHSPHIGGTGDFSIVPVSVFMAKLATGVLFGGYTTWWRLTWTLDVKL